MYRWKSLCGIVFLMGRIQKLCNILSNIVMYIVKGGFTWQEEERRTTNDRL